MRYKLTEVFSSIQGEGFLSGTPMTFLRFQGCNLQCSFCDEVDKKFYDEYDQTTLLNKCLAYRNHWVILTGGEPTIQVDQALINLLHRYGFKIAIESNGLIEAPRDIDYVTLSPKTPEIAPGYALRGVNELRYPIKAGDELPKPHCRADHLYLSPIFNKQGKVSKNIAHAILLAEENQLKGWRVSVQMHKLIGVR